MTSAPDEKSNIIDLTEILAINNVRTILNINFDEAHLLFSNLKTGQTLARGLRQIGYTCVGEITPENWQRLRHWRSQYIKSES